MTCDAIRAALAAGREATWLPGVRAHLAGCEACAGLVVEWSLRQAPEGDVPATFAVDVARLARVAASSGARPRRGPKAGLVAALIAIGLAAAWQAASDDPLAVGPVAALLFACGEAILLAAWFLTADPFRPQA
jgi:hypothetical protein